MLNQCYGACKFLIKYLSILFLFCVAIYVLATRIALGLLPEYTEQIEDFLSEKIQKPVTIASFTSRWDGLDPVLDVNGLSIEGSEPFYLGRVRFQFAFWPSILALSPKFERILLEQAELTVKQHADGRWFVLIDDLGLSIESDQNQLASQESYQPLLQYLALFNGTTLNLKDISANIYKHNGTKRNLRLPTLNVNYKDEQIFASGQVLENQGQKALLNFSLSGRGFFSLDAIRGTLYVEARSSEFFGELLSIYDWQKLSIQSVEASSRAWINFSDMHIDSIYGDVQVNELNWNMAEKSLPPINDLAFSYFWNGNSEEQVLSFDALGFEWAGLKCDPGDVRVQSAGSNLFIQAEKLNLQCANRLALSLDMVSEKLNSRLYQSNPKGFLKNIHLTLLKTSVPVTATLEDQSVQNISTEIIEPPAVSEEGVQFTLEALLDNVSISAYDSTPSGKNITGYVFADNTSGYVSFMSDNFELGFPKLFLAPWEIRQAEGRVNWLLKEQKVSIFSEGLRLWRDEESLIYGDFTLRLNSKDQEDYLALAIGMQDILFTDAVKFVPFYEVDEGLYDWLSESLIHGLVSSGVYYGYGSVESDHQENSFTSSLHLNTEKGGLKFAPDWPALTQLDADLFLQNGQLNIEADRAMIAESVLENIKADMPEGKPGQANFLTVSAHSTINNDGIHYWLSESPIAETTRPVAEQLTIDALAKTHIDLKIPVAQAEQSKAPAELAYRVEVNLNDASIDHPDSDLSFTKVQGALVVDSRHGVNASDMTLKLFDKPARLAIKTEYHNGFDDAGKVKPTINKTTLTRLFLEGDLGMAAVFDYLKIKKPSVLSGDLHYSAKLTLSDQDKQYPMLLFESDLLGVRCQCPAPFAKTEKQSAKLNLSLLLKPEQSYLKGRLSSSYMPEVKTELLFVEDKPSFGELLIGGAKVSNTKIKGLNIAAKFNNKVKLKDWIDFLSENVLSEVPENTQAPIKVLAEHAVPKDSSFLKQIQLYIDTLDAFDFMLQNTALKLAPDDNGQWHIGVSGKDISGRISLATQDKPLSLDLNSLNLISTKVDESAKNKAGLTSESASIDPRSFPEVNFKTANLLLDGRSIGNWQFDLQADEQGSVFRNLKGYFKSSTISGQVNWLNEVDIQRTIATLAVEGKDIASIFAMLSLPPLINSERYKADIAFVWPAAPYDFSLSALSGKLSVDLESGFIKTEDEKTGALRLFGILNAESIKRRLKLDFSDLYKSGIGYDSIKGAASIDNGLLTLTQALEIEGPAGKYLLNGRSDLATKALDFDMLVELPFSQNFPLAALVLGAPQVGGLVWVADKLLGEPLSALTTSRYDITGTWEQPRVDLRQAMNASKKDRSNEKGMRDANH